MKIKEKESAIAMRKDGFSMREISEKIGVSKSTVSLWTRDIPLGFKARRILKSKLTNGQIAAQESHRIQTKVNLAAARKFGIDEVANVQINTQGQKVLCAMLYWCEGAKSPRDSSFIFTNSDPTLVQTFLALLRNNFTLDEKKFRVVLHLHEYHNEDAQLQFWSKVTTIPRSQFLRSYWKPRSGKQIREGYAGCASIRYHDVRVSRQVQAIARAFMETQQ